VHVMGRDDIYPVRMSEVGCHCSDNRPWTSLLDIYHPVPWPVAATTVLVLLMMDTESVRNMESNLAVTNKW